MKRVALCTLACAWLAACETSPSGPTPLTPLGGTPLVGPRSFQTLSNEQIPVAGALVFNPCPPAETVEILNGFLHFLVTGEVGPTSQDITIHVNGQGIEGVGTVTGERYSVPDNEKTSITFTQVPLSFTQETDFRLRLIRAGELDNLWLRVTFTFTFPPGTIDVRRMEIECRG